MSVVATLVSYGCIQVFVAACVLRWAHSGDGWLARRAIPQSAGFRDPPTGTRERWWIPKETLWGTTLIVVLGVGGLWPVAWSVELYRCGWALTHVDVRIAWFFAALLLTPALAALRIVLRRHEAASQAQTIGVLALLFSLGATLLPSPNWHLHRCPWRYPPESCEWLPVLLALTATGLSVLLLRAGAKAEAAELSRAADPET